MKDELICKWKFTDSYCWATRYGCIDCPDYEPIYQRPEINDDIKKYVDSLNNSLNKEVK